MIRALTVVLLVLANPVLASEKQQNTQSCPRVNPLRQNIPLPSTSKDDQIELAQIIYDSQMSCLGRERARAIYKTSMFSPIERPELLTALVYALIDDKDEDVRFAAASRIKDILTLNPSICIPELRVQLTCALGDCDEKVAKLAEQALAFCSAE